jgi:hypothetical protein
VRRLAAALACCAGLVGGAALVASAGPEDPKKQDVSNMDLDLLRENLLKIWIIEYTSQAYNQGRIAEKSFEALNPAPPTGDPETDRKNAEGRRKTDKELRHYMALELDGSIEAIDICDRVLGQKVAIDPTELEKRRFLLKELPEFRWSSKLLQDCLAELQRLTSTTIELHPVIPKNVTLEVSLESPAGYTVQAVLEYINGIHPIEWKYENGKLDVTYLGDLPRTPYGR